MDCRHLFNILGRTHLIWFSFVQRISTIILLSFIIISGLINMNTSMLVHSTWQLKPLGKFSYWEAHSLYFRTWLNFNFIGIIGNLKKKPASKFYLYIFIYMILTISKNFIKYLFMWHGIKLLLIGPCGHEWSALYLISKGRFYCVLSKPGGIISCFITLFIW